MPSSTAKIEITLADGAKMPRYATPGAAGLDLCSTHDIELAPLERTLAKTGIKMAIPQGYEGQVRPRSGLALRLGLSMVNSPGTIDSDYRGEIGVILVNLSNQTIKLQAGERIAQLVICPVEQVELIEVQELDETQRGGAGFGSTGTV